ncbi:hypothetical protein [Streptomyces sp. A1-5]|uniref:hypothetical protein n=1 Tax=Streptomyces sp. A1-5 TaxID=2738410 RepID=UPI001F36A07D|nr:hypothetical protein [Streptomyces sp. A1-5]UJB43629.1 hypothetical protein HRD51_25045 [Streptomyces sp. A1-5]
MTVMDYEALTVDLIRRTEAAVENIANLAVQAGVTFKIEDIVQLVEDKLPADYPQPTTGDRSRRDVIAAMAQDVLSGEMYDD